MATTPTSQPQATTSTPQVPASLPNFSAMSPEQLKSGAIKYIQTQQASGQDMKQIVGTLSSWGITLNSDGTATYQAPQTKPQGLFSAIGSDLSKRSGEVNQLQQETRPDQMASQAAGSNLPLNEKGKELITTGEKGLQVAGQVAGGVNDIVGEVVKRVPIIGPLIQKAGTAVMDTQTAQNLLQKYDAFSQKHPEAAKDLEATFNLGAAATLYEGAASDTAASTASKAVESVGSAAQKIADVAGTAGEKIGNIPSGLAEKLTPSTEPAVEGAKTGAVTEERLNQMAEEAKLAKKNPGENASPKTTEGENIKTEATNKLNKAIPAAQAEKEAQLTKYGDKEVTGTAPANPRVASKGGTLSDIAANFAAKAASFKNVGGKFADESLNEFQLRLGELLKNPTISNADKFVDDFAMQGKNLDNPRLGKIMNSTVHDIDESVKSTTDALEKDAGDTNSYRTANQKYRELKDLSYQVDKRSGAKIVDSLMNANDTSLMGLKKYFPEMKSGGRAAIADIFDKAASSINVDDFTKKIGISHSIPIMAARTLLRVVSGDLSTPEAQLSKLLKLLPKD